METDLGPKTQAVPQTALGPRRLPAFTIPDTELGMGASLGNSAVWINTKSTGAIERVSPIKCPESLFGTIIIRYAGTGVPLSDGWLGPAHAAGSSYVGVRPDNNVRTFEIHPACQRVTFTIVGAVRVVETTFVPLLSEDTEAQDDPPIAYQSILLHNADVYQHNLRITAYARLRGSTIADIQARYDERCNAIVAWNRGDRRSLRIFAMLPKAMRYSTTFDFGSVYDPSHVHALTNTTDVEGDILGCLQTDITLEPGAVHECCLKAGAFVGVDEAQALDTFCDSLASDVALQRTIEHLDERVHFTEIVAPDALINQGALWSKVNMRRVMATYPQGRAFTNDPGNTPNLVVRDAAWFIFGNDYFMPEFSRSLLKKLIGIQYRNGKMPEYTDAITGKIEDDGLNINDDTPLFILAAHHHFQATGDKAWLQEAYPAVARAARYILSQRDKRGLIFCNATDPRGYVWAIASWRNIIPLYTINGAVTEINAECAAALRAAAELAAQTDDHGADGPEFSAGYQSLRDAINSHLINPENGLFYLNIDAEGNVHTDVTGDEVFPVIFRVCDDETAFRIISRLNAPDFWTPAGLRTASRVDPLYDPSHYSGLMGGVWPGLTWWYAFAAAPYHPEFMVRALRSSFEHYGTDPKKNNTVPGQFSEWFDGESLTNKGMRLSPWEPPRFLWAAVEGVCGLTLTSGVPCINPLIPLEWSWVGLRRLRYHGGELSYFMIRKGTISQIYTTAQVESDSEMQLFSRDVTDDLAVFSASAAAIALAKENEFAILVGNVGDQTSTIPMNLSRLVDANTNYMVRLFNSERGAWEEPEEELGSELSTLALSIESKGFRLLNLARI
ncbi:MAG: hypothetical protein JO177_03410 [Candidatus Eremiobacteraeota bacterium]|nr:hypothetical protein [Candidatus Eremiobacteraeota bacterium]